MPALLIQLNVTRPNFPFLISFVYRSVNMLFSAVQRDLPMTAATFHDGTDSNMMKRDGWNVMQDWRKGHHKWLEEGGMTVTALPMLCLDREAKATTCPVLPSPLLTLLIKTENGGQECSIFFLKLTQASFVPIPSMKGAYSFLGCENQKAAKKRRL